MFWHWLDSQPVSAFCPAASENSSAGFSFHSFAETVLFLPAQPVWLIGSFHLSPEVKFSINLLT